MLFFTSLLWIRGSDPIVFDILEAYKPDNILICWVRRNSRVQLHVIHFRFHEEKSHHIPVRLFHLTSVRRNDDCHFLFRKLSWRDGCIGPWSHHYNTVCYALHWYKIPWLFPSLFRTVNFYFLTWSRILRIKLSGLQSSSLLLISIKIPIICSLYVIALL